MADDMTTTAAEETAGTEGSATALAEPVEVNGEALTPGPSVLQRMQALPDSVKTYLMSDELAALHKKIFDEHGVTEDDRDVIHYTELQTFFGEIPVAEFPDRLWNRMTWDDAQEEKAAALMADILGYVFLPAQAHLGDVTGILADLGGDIKKYPEKQLEMRRITFVEGAREIAAAAAPEGLSEEMQKRLAHIVESRLRQVRDDVDTKEMLMKSKKTGGMELSEADADKVVAMIASKTRMTAFAEMLEEKIAETPGEQAQPAPTSAKELSPLEIKKLYTGTAEEQEAIAKRVDRFRKVTESDPAKMRDAFHQIIYPPDLRPTDPLYVAAGLIAMADGDQLSDAVENDERYREILREFFRGKGMEEDLAAFEQEPTAPRFMNILFQVLLRGVAGYDENQSARLCLRALNALKKQGYDRYADLVAFDMDKGEFRWKEAVQP